MIYQELTQPSLGPVFIILGIVCTKNLAHLGTVVQLIEQLQLDV